MNRPSTAVVLLGVAVVALFDGLLSLTVGYLPAVLFSGGATAERIGLFLAVASLATLVVSPVGAFLLGHYAGGALDVADRLPRVTALVFVVGYLASVVGLLLGVVSAPPSVDPAGGPLSRLLPGALRTFGETVVLTLAVVGGAALGRLRG